MSSTTADSEKHIVLVSKEGEKVPFPVRLVKYCKMLETLTGGFEKHDSDSDSDSDEDSDSQAKNIPLPTLSTKDLNYVMQFATMYDNSKMETIPKPIPSNDLPAFIRPKKFGDWVCELDSQDTCNLIIAAQYLDIRPLLELSCARLASFIKDHTPDEICKTFGADKAVLEEQKAAIADKHGMDANDLTF